MRHRVLTVFTAFLLVLPSSAQQHHSDGLDDVMQHVPMASVLVMKACGADNGHGWTETLGTMASSYVLSAGVAWGLKHSVKEWRPDDSNQRSFPSGHATLAFAGATTLRHEYGQVSPWIAVGGYTVAVLTAADRVRRDRHYWHDVCAGAAIGVLSTELVYYIKGKMRKDDRVSVAFSPNSLYVAVNW